MDTPRQEGPVDPTIAMIDKVINDPKERIPYITAHLLGHRLVEQCPVPDAGSEGDGAQIYVYKRPDKEAAFIQQLPA